MNKFIPAAITLAVIGIIFAGTAALTQAQVPDTAFVGTNVKIVATECPCEIRFDHIPRGIGGWWFQFGPVNAAPTVESIPGWTFTDPPGVTSTAFSVLKETRYAEVSYADVDQLFEPGDFNVHLFTFTAPADQKYELKRYLVDDDNGDIFSHSPWGEIP